MRAKDWVAQLVLATMGIALGAALAAVVAAPAKHVVHLKGDCELSRDLILASIPLQECEERPEAQACREASDWFMWRRGKPDRSWAGLLEKGAKFLDEQLHVTNYATSLRQAAQRVSFESHRINR